MTPRAWVSEVAPFAVACLAVVWPFLTKVVAMSTVFAVPRAAATDVRFVLSVAILGAVVRSAIVNHVFKIGRAHV